MATEYMEKRDAILKDRSASDWLKNALFSLERRDPCDALGDVEALLELAQLRLHGTLNAAYSVANSAMIEDMRGDRQAQMVADSIPPLTAAYATINRGKVDVRG